MKKFANPQIIMILLEQIKFIYFLQFLLINFDLRVMIKFIKRSKIIKNVYLKREPVFL